MSSRRRTEPPLPALPDTDAHDLPLMTRYLEHCLALKSEWFGGRPVTPEDVGFLWGVLDDTAPVFPAFDRHSDAWKAIAQGLHLEAASATRAMANRLGVDGDALLREARREDSSAWKAAIEAARVAVGGSGGATATETPTHAPDFTSVDWFGTRYTFTKGNQAQAVKALWEAWKQGGHGLSGETICSAVGSSAGRFELAKVFRSRGNGRVAPHPAWGTMIVSFGKGCYRLHRPESA